MKKILFGCCAALLSVVSVAAEVVVNSGETLVLNGGGADNLRETIICAKGGSTLKILPMEGLPAGTRGFAAYHGTTLPTDAEWPAVGTSRDAALAAFKYSQFDGAKQTLECLMMQKSGVQDRQFDLYAATWTVPEAMTISLFEHTASKVLVILDETVVLSDHTWNHETTKKDIAVSAGDHTLIVIVATEGWNECTSVNSNKNSDGRYGFASGDRTAPGLVYNTANADLALKTSKPGASGCVADTYYFQNESEEDSSFTVYTPTELGKETVDASLPQPVFAANMRILVDGGEVGGGEVRLDLSECVNPAEGIALVGGIQTTNNGSVVVVGTDRLRVGGYSNGGKHWTFYGVPLTFKNADDTDNMDGMVAFEKYVTIRTPPPKWTIAANTDVALMGVNLLGTDDVTIDNFDLQVQSADAVVEGKTIFVGAGRTLSLKPCKVDSNDCWQWYGIEGAITNNITLGGTGALLKLPNVVSIDVVGHLGGTGNVRVEYDAMTPKSAETTFESASFVGTITAIKGGIAFKQATPGAAENTVVVGEEYGWGTGCHGWVRLSPEGAGERETVARIRRVEARSDTGTNSKTGVQETPMDGSVMVARRQTMQIGTFAGQGCVRGDDAEAASFDCSAAIDVLEANAFLRVLLGKRCSIGLMETDSTARLMPQLECFEADVLEAGTTVVAQGPTAIRLGEASKAELRVADTTATVNLTLGAGETPNGSLRRLTFESAATVVLTNGAIQTVGGPGTLVIAGTVRVGHIAPETVVRVLDGGRIVATAQAVPGVYDLGVDIDPALWLDADAGAATYRQLSFAEHPNVVYTNDSVVIDQWFDVRPGQRDYYGWNRRCEGKPDDTHQQVYPYLLTNSCNGRTTLQFDKYGGRVPGQWGAPFKDDGKTYRAGRRLPFNKPITARYAVMVFGSENGGGTSVLGGYMSKADVEVDENGKVYNTPGVLQRFADEVFMAEDAYNDNSDLYKMARDWTQPLFHVNRPTWVDGVRVDPTQRNVLNGGYQILAFEIADDEGNGVPVQSLGSCSKVDTSGRDAAGQIYGEVLIFTNALTAVQRQRVEQYLSRKWGIPLKEKGEVPPGAAVDVLAGGSVTVEGDAPGGVVFAGASSLTLGGDYLATGAHLGTVTLTGGLLEIPALAVPPSESEIPTDNLRGWYDPDDATRYVTRTIADNERPLAMDALFSKFSGTTAETYDGQVAYLWGFLNLDKGEYSTDSKIGDRRPWKAEGARGTGPSRTWLDYTVYSNDPVQDGLGNCLRPKNVFKEAQALGGGGRVAQGFKTAFIVTDTSKGGGNPICDRDNPVMSPTVERAGYDYTAAIWPSGAPTAFTNGRTFLDGRQVDGTSRGYTGRPELLTVQTDGTDKQFYAIGYYNGKGPDGEAGECSYEILGEMIFYTTVLDDTTRTDIEAYLMKKWLGKVPAGYVDWRDATITGEGSVLAPSPVYLPKFDAAFSGTVALTNTVLTFNADAAGAVTNALALPAGVTVNLPAQGTVNVTGSKRVHGAVLVDAGAVALGEQTSGVVEGWALNLTPANTEAKLKLEGGKLKLVFPSGMVILFR